MSKQCLTDEQRAEVLRARDDRPRIGILAAMTSPDLATRIVAIFTDEGVCLPLFQQQGIEELIRQQLAQSPELAQIREALEKAKLETETRGIDYGIPAVADACADALTALDRLTGRSP